MNDLLRDRKAAGLQLSKVLAEYKNSNAVVVGIPHGGVCVAAVIAEELSLPLEIMPCRRIKHPADGKRAIGSVSEDEVFIHDCSHTIPQDYVGHQIVLLKHAISHEVKKYYGDTTPQSFRYRTVILVDDILSGSDKMMACLKSIKRQAPLKVVIAVPIVAAEAAHIVGAEVDDIKFLKMEATLGSPLEYYAEFSKVDEKSVKALFEASRKMVKLYE